ncbi:hypothetical protein GGF42_002073 [Coemansia sp. RSA 2424]|nr:hypothetical protein GGF42_002073 [Coemansia sp. RSA 2424]
MSTQRLLRQIRIANNNPTIREEDLKETMEALNWLAEETNGTWTRKNSWCRMITCDSNIRSFAIGAMFGVLPVAVREWAWYPQAYEQNKWQICPCCHTETETQAHFFACEASHQVRGPGEEDDELGSRPDLQQEVRSRAPAMVPRPDRWTIIRREHTNNVAGLTEGDGEETAPDDDEQVDPQERMWLWRQAGIYLTWANS